MLRHDAVTKYPYSKGQIYFAAVFIAAMCVFFIYFLITNISDPDAWMIGLVF